MIKMKNLVTTLIAAATIAASSSSHAALNSKQFDQVVQWARTQGYFYEGTWTSRGLHNTPCYWFSNRQDKRNGGMYLAAAAPVSSDTADEAINAIIASSVVAYEMTLIAQEVVTEERTRAYEAGASGRY
jgi:GH18 family chitinase